MKEKHTRLQKATIDTVKELDQLTKNMNPVIPTDIRPPWPPY